MNVLTHMMDWLPMTILAVALIVFFGCKAGVEVTWERKGHVKIGPWEWQWGKK